MNQNRQMTQKERTYTRILSGLNAVIFVSMLGILFSGVFHGGFSIEESVSEIPDIYVDSTNIFFEMADTNVYRISYPAETTVRECPSCWEYGTDVESYETSSDETKIWATGDDVAGGSSYLSIACDVNVFDLADRSMGGETYLDLLFADPGLREYTMVELGFPGKSDGDQFSPIASGLYENVESGTDMIEVLIPVSIPQKSGSRLLWHVPSFFKISAETFSDDASDRWREHNYSYTFNCLTNGCSRVEVQ